MRPYFTTIIHVKKLKFSKMIQNTFIYYVFKESVIYVFVLIVTRNKKLENMQNENALGWKE